MSIYKACDIRGKFGSELRVEHAARLGRALAALVGPGPVLLCGDGRESTPVLKEALASSLVGGGFDVLDLGIAPTPLFYFSRRRLGIDLGVMVTASHNPAGDNGFKLTLGPLPVTTAEMGEIERLMETGGPASRPEAGYAAPAGTHRKADLLEDYLAFLAAHTPDLRGLKVVVDCASGMAGLVARQAWAKSGADAVFLLEQVDGRFPAHPPNPAEEKNLALLQAEVRSRCADLGVAYDGDADRVVFVDETGRAVTGDQAIVLFARDALRHGPRAVVYDQKCSRVVADTIRELGGTPVMELSGHTFIKRAFLEQDAAYAGELSGHHFFRSAGGDDAPAASLFFAGLLKASGQRLSQLTGAIPAYATTPDLRIPMAADAIRALIERLEGELGGEAAVTRRDGLRLEWADGWGLVRPSVTEPVITMRFEGKDAAALRRILGRIRAAAPELAGVLHVSF